MTPQLDRTMDHPEYVKCADCGRELHPDCPTYGDLCVITDLGPCEHSWDQRFEYRCVECAGGVAAGEAIEAAAAALSGLSNASITIDACPEAYDYVAAADGAQERWLDLSGSGGLGRFCTAKATIRGVKVTAFGPVEMGRVR